MRESFDAKTWRVLIGALNLKRCLGVATALVFILTINGLDPLSSKDMLNY